MVTAILLKMNSKAQYSMRLALYAVGMAMGVVGLVLNFLGPAGNTPVILLGIGVFALGMAGINSVSGEPQNAKA